MVLMTMLWRNMFMFTGDKAVFVPQSDSQGRSERLWWTDSVSCAFQLNLASFSFRRLFCSIHIFDIYDLLRLLLYIAFLSSFFWKEVWKPNHHSLSAQCHSTLFCLQCCSLLSFVFHLIYQILFHFIYYLWLLSCHISYVNWANYSFYVWLLLWVEQDPNNRQKLKTPLFVLCFKDNIILPRPV